MPRWISYTEAAILTDRHADNEEASAQAALRVLAAGLRWNAQFNNVEEDPALSAEAYALAFPMHRAVFRELAALMRDSARGLGPTGSVPPA